MTNKKISALTGASTPLSGTELVPIVQSGTTSNTTVSNLTAGRAVAVGSLTSAGQVRVNNTAATNSLSYFATGSTTGYVLGGLSNTSGGVYYGVEGSVGGNLIVGSSAYDGVLYSVSGLSFSGNNGNNLHLRIASGGDTTFTVGNLIQGTAAKGINFTANTPAAGMTSQLLNWYEEGSYTPTLSSFTVVGVATATCTYTRIGRTVVFNVKIQSTTSIACTGGTSNFNLPFTAGTPSAALTAANGSAFTGLSNGFISGGAAYPPSFSFATQPIYISGTYTV